MCLRTDTLSSTETFNPQLLSKSNFRPRQGAYLHPMKDVPYFLRWLAKRVVLPQANYRLSHHYLCITALWKSKNRCRTRWRSELINTASPVRWFPSNAENTCETFERLYSSFLWDVFKCVMHSWFKTFSYLVKKMHLIS